MTELPPAPWRIVRASEYTDEPEDTTILRIEAADGTTILYTDGGYHKPQEQVAAAIVALPQLVKALQGLLAAYDNRDPEEFRDASPKAHAALRAAGVTP